MAAKLLLYLVTFALFQGSLQDIDDNEVFDEEIPLVETSSVHKPQNQDNISEMIGNIMTSEGGKQIGEMLLNAAQNNSPGTAQILQGLGAFVQRGMENTGKTGGAGGTGFDPNLIANILNMLGNQETSKQHDNLDIGSIISSIGGMMSQDGSENVMGYVPTILSTLSSFVGPEAETRVQTHEDHAWFLPPMLEKAHVLFDLFIHSEFGRSLMTKLGAEKFVKIFADEDGKFSYSKFIELLENQSFRKHWIKMVTQRVAEVISYFADPYTQKKFVTTVQFFVNNFLKSQGVPKAALYDPSRQTESISSLINHLSKRFFGYKFDAKKYVRPAVLYGQEALKLAEERGLVNKAIDSEKLNNKLADTINLEMIEPLVRVNRAFRFASKVPSCDRYVMCLVNEKSTEEESLPGLRAGLSRISSIFLSWFLSGRTGTSFWSLYHVITDENNCKARYLDECHDFHLEEIKATTEYVHNEL